MLQPFLFGPKMAASSSSENGRKSAADSWVPYPVRLVLMFAWFACSDPVALCGVLWLVLSACPWRGWLKWTWRFEGPADGICWREDYGCMCVSAPCRLRTTADYSKKTPWRLHFVLSLFIILALSPCPRLRRTSSCWARELKPTNDK